MTAVMISARNIGMQFETQSVLRDVSIEIAEGSFVSIVGPSGCGKSTFLRLVAGLRTASSGELRIHAQPAAQATQRRAFVFQDPNLLPWRTVSDNVALPLELEGEATREKRQSNRERITQTLQLVGLTQVDALKRPRQLSGGMRMRVSLARALVTNPEIMLLDEPFAALDDILRQQLNEELQSIWWQKRWTGLFVTHNVSEAVFLSQRVLVMSARPATFLADITVPFEFPRTPALRAEPEFAKLCHHVSQQLRHAAGVPE